MRAEARAHRTAMRMCTGEVVRGSVASEGHASSPPTAIDIEGTELGNEGLNVLELNQAELKA